LEDGGINERVEEADDCVVHVPKGADADLADEKDDDGMRRAASQMGTISWRMG